MLKTREKATSTNGLEMTPVHSEVFSPSAFLAVSARDRHNIRSVHIVPPSLGAPGFGSVRIIYNRPVYRSEAFGE